MLSRFEFAALFKESDVVNPRGPRKSQHHRYMGPHGGVKEWVNPDNTGGEPMGHHKII